MKTKRLVPVLVALIAATSLPAQIFVSLNKGIHYTQTGVSTVTPNNPTPYNFNADVSGTGVTASFPAGPIQATAPNMIGYTMTYDPSWGGWQYESTPAPDLGTFNMTYPNGTWALAAGGNTWNLSLTGDLYPNFPVATFSAGTWTGGQLYLSAAEAAAGFTITTNTFTDNFSAGMSYVGMNLGSLESNNYPALTANSVTLVVPGGALAPGSHELSIDFNRLTALDNTVSGYVAVIGYNANTNLMIQVEAIPEPATWAAMLAGGLNLLGFMAWRRRRQPRA